MTSKEQAIDRTLAALDGVRTAHTCWACGRQDQDVRVHGGLMLWYYAGYQAKWYCADAVACAKRVQEQSL